MAKTPDPEDVERRVEAYLTQRREAVRELSKAQAAMQQTKDDGERERQALEERLAAALKDAETRDAQAWGAALNAGWTEEELRRVGFSEPSVKPRIKRRRTTSTGGTSRSAEPRSAAGSTGAATAASQTSPSSAGAATGSTGPAVSAASPVQI